MHRWIVTGSQARRTTKAGRPPLVVYETRDREGSTFALSSETRRQLEQIFGRLVHPSPRIFVAHETRNDYQHLHGPMAKQILLLLTGLNEEQFDQVGPIEFRDPVTERPL